MKLDKIIGLLCVTFNPWSNKKIKLEIYACIYCQHIRKIKKNNHYNDYLWLCTQLKEI